MCCVPAGPLRCGGRLQQWQRRHRLQSGVPSVPAGRRVRQQRWHCGIAGVLGRRQRHCQFRAVSQWVLLRISLYRVAVLRWAPCGAAVRRLRRGLRGRLRINILHPTVRLYSSERGGIQLGCRCTCTGSGLCCCCCVRRNLLGASTRGACRQGVHVLLPGVWVWGAVGRLLRCCNGSSPGSVCSVHVCVSLRRW